MFKGKTILILLSLLLLTYLLLCIVIYTQQKTLLFPASMAKIVPPSWEPIGQNSEQAIMPGSCGQLHVALWRTLDAKGTLMMHHGNGESLASIDEYVYAFHDLGYNLMAWDYPGYGKSTDCWFSQDTLLADAEHAYQWLASQENPKSIHQFGYSLGTGIALSIASRHDHNPVYLVAAYDSLTNVAIDNMPSFIPVKLILRYPMQTRPWVGRIKQPIHLLHGVDDQLIHPAHAKSLVDLSAGSATIQWVENAGHADDTLFAARNQWLKQLLP